MADSFDKLRRAGAVARETLKLAASQHTGIPVAQLTTANGAVQLPDGTQLAYTELAATAAGLEPVTDVTLRDPSQWRLIGKPMERLDIVAKSTGTLPYGIDLTVEGMVHAAIRVNPRKGGVLNGYDAARRGACGACRTSSRSRADLPSSPTTRGAPSGRSTRSLMNGVPRRTPPSRRITGASFPKASPTTISTGSGAMTVTSKRPSATAR
jgi:hypothetical protein